MLKKVSLFIFILMFGVLNKSHGILTTVLDELKAHLNQCTSSEALAVSNTINDLFPEIGTNQDFEGIIKDIFENDEKKKKLIGIFVNGLKSLLSQCSKGTSSKILAINNQINDLMGNLIPKIDIMQDAKAIIKDIEGIVVKDVLENDENNKKAIEIFEVFNELLKPFIQGITENFENVFDKITIQLFVCLCVFTVQIAEKEIERLKSIIN
jgi:hypothetical protein